MSLTSYWRAGKLEKCKRYWVKSPLSLETKPAFLYNDNSFDVDGTIYPNNYDLEVLAPCNYDHFVELTEKAKKYDRIKINGNYPDKISKLKSRIKHLLELQANQDKEVENLRELLKECKEEILSWFYQGNWAAEYDMPLDVYNFLTRISIALGEIEEE